MSRTPTSLRLRSAIAVALAASALHGPAAAADIDIYATSTGGEASNVMLFLDNTSNWSASNQAWTPTLSWNKCPADTKGVGGACRTLIETIFYQGLGQNVKRPWENGYNNNQAPSLPQGVVEVRALKLVLQQLVCGASKPLAINVGLSMFTPDKGSARNSGDAVAIIYHAIRPLTVASGNCAALLAKLDTLDVKINDPQYKAPSDADYGSAFYEIFKYFGGYTNPKLAEDSLAGSPVGAQGYGTTRFSQLNVLDDLSAFTNSSRAVYKSPISPDGACGNNYLVLIGNRYPNKENAGPTSFSGLNYTPPALSAVSSDTSRLADEWSQFLANTDVSDVAGMQRVYSYAMNVYNDSADPSQTRLLKSIAAVGGIGGEGYIEVGGDLYKLVDSFKNVFLQVAAIDSVFTATTLPVSTTTQGTYLNQVFVGSFRPDAQFNPRWLGNLKQFELGFKNDILELIDATGNAAVLGSTGFFSPLAVSFWTKDSVFFDASKSGTPPSESDRPDGSIVEKGGVAQRLRTDYEQGAGTRKVYTLPPSPSGSALSTFPVTHATLPSFNATEIAWVRGEANVDGAGKEEFVGSYCTAAMPCAAANVMPLGLTGARHSIHADVLHSRPVAVNYGGDNVVVYYGSNDGLLRAIDGRKTHAAGGSELWSFIAPEHYSMLKRLRAGTPKLHLPETTSAGVPPITPPADAKTKDYAFDGPIGSYVLYQSGATPVKEAMIYAGMRRGGNAVYAFNVTDRFNPTFAWKKDSTSLPGLAQTWSMAKPIVYKSTSGDPPVVVMMGGGYDVGEENNQTGSSGNRIFFLNGRTGQLLKSVNTDHSVAADVTVVDLQGDGIPDRAYAVDVRGKVYRVDLPSANVLNPDSWNSVTPKKIANLGGKAYFAVDAVVTRDFVAVLVGTGDREKPLLTSKICCADEPATASATEGFYMVKDTKAGQPARNVTLEPKDLAHIAKVKEVKEGNQTKLQVEAVTPNEDLKVNGCYMTLAERGEKVVNAPTTIAGVAYFGTNYPSSGDNLSCKSGLGDAYAYRFPLFCKPPLSTKLETGGMPPSPVAGVVLIGDKKVPFIIGGGTRGSPFTPEQPNPVVSPVRTRQFWYIDNANR